MEALIRRGEPKDGHQFWFMPSETFQYLSDADLAALIAYLRSYRPAGTKTPPIRRGPLFEELVRKGEFQPAKEAVARFAVEQPTDLGERHRLGRYIAMTTCTECHNSKLQGYEGFSADLVSMAGAYDEEAFRRLLTTGEGKSKKDLGLMTKTSQHRFARLSTAERDAVIAYLTALAESPR